MIIRDDPGEARRVWAAQLAHNLATEADEPDPWVGSVDDVAKRLADYLDIGFSTLVVSALAPFDEETFERLISEVAPAARHAVLSDRGGLRAPMEGGRHPRAS